MATAPTTPDIGERAVIDSLNPAPDTSSLPAVSGGGPTAPVDNSAPAPSTPPAPASPADTAQAGPQKPSLWKGLLFGALHGLAAGSQVNTRGMGTGSAIAAGIGAGAGAELARPAQQAQQSAELDRTKMETAVHYANLAKIQRDIHMMPDTKQEQYLNQAADQTEAMTKAGAITPLSEPTDLLSAQKTLMSLHAQNPWAVYSVVPIRGNDGSMKYSTVQFAKAPLQKDLKLSGGGDDGKDITIPAGTPADQVGKFYTNHLSKQLEADAKKDVAKGNNDTKVKVQGMKGQTALDVQGLKNEGAAAKASTKPPDMASGTDSEGNQIAGTVDELKTAGATGITKLQGTEQQKVVVARQLIGPRKGLFDLVNKDIDTLAAQGKLGVAASRFGEFMAGKVGNDPEFQPLRTHMGLLSTALMQAHVGARGSKDMLEHFKELANYSISNEATLRKALQAEWEYVNEKAMLPKSNPAAGRTGPGQAGPAQAAAAPLKGVQKSTGKPVVSNDGGKTWQLAQ